MLHRSTMFGGTRTPDQQRDGHLQNNLSNTSSRYLDGQYLAENPDWHADDSAWKAKHIAAILKRQNIIPGRLAEIGCGSGRCVQLVHNIYPGTVADGFEISPQAYALCTPLQTDTLHFYNASPFDTGRTYDVMMALDVIEHVEDPFKFISQMAAMSTYQLFHIPLDMSALSVAREWPILDARSQIGHLHYFTRGTALALLEDCGLEVVDDHYTPWAIDQSYKSWKKRVAALPRRVAFTVARHATVRLVGGWSLMVLTRPKTSTVAKIGR
jgi:SAM-dependent methyltransferase